MASEATDGEHQRELREYAWKYFRYHAEQRLRTFHFYLIVCGLLLGGTLATLSTDPDLTMTQLRWSIGLVLVLLSGLFWKLDCRNRQLVGHGETALRFIEGRMGLPDIEKKPHVTNIFRYEHCLTKARGKRHWGYERCFNYVFFIFAFIGVTVAYVAGDWWWWFR